MRYMWKTTGLGITDNLGAQFAKIVRNTNQLSIQTRRRYIMAMERFLKHLGTISNLQKIANIQDKHVELYANTLKLNGCSDKYIKTELSALRYWHNKIHAARYALEDANRFNKRINLGPTSDGRADRAWTYREYEAMRSIALTQGRSDIAKVLEGSTTLE